MRRFLGILFLMLLGSLAPAYGSLTNVYIAQSSAGANNGTSCANAYAMGFLTSSGNWGSGAGQIGAGTTIHLCGTINVSANTIGINFYGSGSSGNPITLLFETGAVLQSPYFPSANPLAICSASNCGAGISVSGQNYIIIDGGTNGILQNTANGTSLANQQGSIGVYLRGSNIIQRNLTVQNIYNHTGTTDGSSAAQLNADVRVDNPSSNVSVCNNTLNNARVGISSDTNSSGGPNLNCSSNTFSTGINYFSNTVADHGWGLNISGTSGAPNIYANDVSGWDNWNNPSSTFHMDGIIASADGGSYSIAPYIYDNYFHGSLNASGTGNATGYVYCTDTNSMGNSDTTSCHVFNNVFDMPTPYNASPFVTDNESGGPQYLYNNTFKGAGSVAAATVEVYANVSSGGTPTINMAGNISVDGGGVWVIHQESAFNSYVPGTIDRDNWYLSTYNSTPFDFGSGHAGGQSLAAWQANGDDVNGVFTNPNLNNTNCSSNPTTCYHPTGTSPGNASSTNFTGSCSGQLAPLCYDKAAIVGEGGGIEGTLRIASGSNNWDAGAYNQGGSPGVATPSISPVSGGYTSPQTITITTATGGATLCYTTDGTTPTANGAGTCTHGTTYSTPFSQTIVTTTTIKAVGSESGYSDSAVATNSYTLAGGSTVANPVISPGTGSYGSPQTVTLTDATGGATICYTTDGSSPLAASPGTCSHGTTYTTSFSVGFSTSVTVKAIGTLATYTNSSIASATYTLSVSACVGPGQGCDTQIRYGIANPTHCDPHAIFGNTAASPTVYYACIATDSWVRIPSNASPTQCPATEVAAGVDSNLNATGCVTASGSGLTVPNPLTRRWAYGISANGYGPTGALIGETIQVGGTSSFATAGTGAGQFNEPVATQSVTTSGSRGDFVSASINVSTAGWALVGQNILFQARGYISVITNVRMRIGIGNWSAATALGSDTLTGTKYCSFRFSTNVPDTNFQAECGDGTSVTTVDTGVAAAANTLYTFSIQMNDSTPNVVFQINGTPVATITTTLPPTNTGMAFLTGLEALTNATETFGLSMFYEEADNN